MVGAHGGCHNINQLFGVCVQDMHSNQLLLTFQQIDFILLEFGILLLLIFILQNQKLK